MSGGLWKSLDVIGKALYAANLKYPNWKAVQCLKVGSGRGMDGMGWGEDMGIGSDTTISQNKLSNTMGSIRKKEFFTAMYTQRSLLVLCVLRLYNELHPFQPHTVIRVCFLPHT